MPAFAGMTMNMVFRVFQQPSNLGSDEFGRTQFLEIPAKAGIQYAAA
jgi:hypothetical protein